MKKKNPLGASIIWFIGIILMSSFLAIIATKCKHKWDVSYTSSVIVSFLFLTTTAHVIARCYRGRIYKHHLYMLDYVCLYTAITGLVSIFSIDASYDKSEADRAISVAKSTLEHAKRNALSGQNYYSTFSEEEDFGGVTRQAITEWLDETLKLLDAEYDEQEWEKFIRDSNELRSGHGRWYIEYTLDGMERYIEVAKDRDEKMARTSSTFFMGVSFIGYWTISLALAIGIVKVSIQAFGWTSEAEVA